MREYDKNSQVEADSSFERRVLPSSVLHGWHKTRNKVRNTKSENKLMNNNQLYNHILGAGVPSPYAAQAADMISATANEAWLGNLETVSELANDFIRLYGIEGDKSLETLKGKLV